MKKISDLLLNDLKGYADLNGKVTDLLKDLKQQHQELFDSWTGEVLDKIKDSTLRYSILNFPFRCSTNLTKKSFFLFVYLPLLFCLPFYFLISLKESDPVVKFTSNSKLMKVTYSPRLVTLITEVRQLTALGYRIPNKIEELSAHAKKFITFAKILEQVIIFGIVQICSLSASQFVFFLFIDCKFSQYNRRSYVNVAKTDDVNECP